MMFRWRKILTVTAIAAVAFANCYAPRFAHAAYQIDSAGQHSKTDGHAHSHGDAVTLPCHTQDDRQDQDNNAGTLKYCCAMACAASAIIWSPAEFPDEPIRERASTVLIEFLQSIAWSAADPPPRSV